MTDQVEVWLDADFLERTRVGTLTHDRGTLRFVYESEWLKNSQAFALDPDLSLGEGTYFPNAEAGNFRVFVCAEYLFAVRSSTLPVIHYLSRVR